MNDSPNGPPSSGWRAPTLAETGGGLVIALIGIGAVVIASGYDFGTMRRMGPGFLPVVVGAVLAVIGIAIALRPEPRETDEPIAISWKKLRAPLFVFGAIAVWCALAEWAGLLIATAALVLVGSLAHPKPNAVRIAISLVVLPLLAVLVFRVGLGLPLNALPRF